MKQFIYQNTVTLFLALIIAFFLSIPNSNAIDIEDFGWSFDNDFDYVYSMLNHDKPSQCHADNGHDNRAVNQRVDDLWPRTSFWGGNAVKPDFYHFSLEPYQSNIIDNQMLPIIIHEQLDEDCNRERVEQFTYCPTNKKIVQYQIDLEMSAVELLGGSQLREGSDKFIAFTKDEILLEADFNSLAGTYFRVYNDQSKTLRETHFMTRLNSNSEARGLVRHKFMKTLDEDYSYHLCPRDISSKVLRPEGMLKGLRKFIEVSSGIISSYEQQRKVFNQCSALFPENKLIYENNWNKYKKINQSLYEEIFNTATQVMMKVDNKDIQDTFNKYVAEFPFVPDNKEACNNWSEHIEPIKDRLIDESSIDYVLKYLN